MEKKFLGQWLTKSFKMKMEKTWWLVAELLSLILHTTFKK
jgi:hypothetical protein